MAFVKKSKAQSCLHAIRQGDSRFDYQKYIIIDSQNEDEVINLRRIDSLQHIDPVLLCEDKRSVILKSKGSTVTNFLSNLTEPERCVDGEISSAEKQVRELQRECELLEKMISDMIEEQSQLMVVLRKQERAESNKKSNQSKHREVHAHQDESFHSNSKEIPEILKSKLDSVAVKDPLSFATPLISKNIERPHRKSLQIMKTVDIKNQTKSRKGKQNETSKKKSSKKTKSTSKAKEIGKSGHSISKIRSKAF